MTPPKPDANSLAEMAAKSVRRPRPERAKEAHATSKSYRTVTASVYHPEADWLDEVTAQLKLAGNSKANRSLVLREAIRSLRDQLDGKTPEEMLRFLTERQANLPESPTS